MNTKPIGIFDSGLGGLTALKELHALLPDQDLLYFADTGRCPYGGRRPEQLRRMAAQNVQLLTDLGAGAVIAACGTVSSTAADVLESFSIPVTGVLKPAVKAVSQLPGTAPVCVIATAASIASGAYQTALEQACPGRRVIGIGCPDFVTLIESGRRSADDPAVREAVERYLAPAKEAGISALLLGCTHYGIIREALSAYLGPQVRLVSASVCAARHMKNMLCAEDAAPLSSGRGHCVFYTSGSAAEFAALAAQLLETDEPLEVHELPPMPA